MQQFSWRVLQSFRAHQNSHLPPNHCFEMSDYFKKDEDYFDSVQEVSISFNRLVRLCIKSYSENGTFKTIKLLKRDLDVYLHKQSITLSEAEWDKLFDIVNPLIHEPYCEGAKMECMEVASFGRRKVEFYGICYKKSGWYFTIELKVKLDNEYMRKQYLTLTKDEMEKLMKQ